MREREREGAHGAGGGALGARGPRLGWAGPGRTGSHRGSKSHDTHNH
jgi:hypothetical protein